MQDDKPTDDLENEEYNTLLELEELESLLELLEEEGISGFEAVTPLPMELKEQMDALGVRDVQQIRDRIMHLHASVDRDENDLTISDS